MGPTGRGIRLSILDRLLAPEQSALTVLRDGLRRDLEDLLNANPRVRRWPAHLTELDHSLLSFGIMDLATVNLATEERRAAVVTIIGEIVREWEPRLANLHAVALPNADPTDRALRIRIEASILLEPSPEPMVFDTIIDPLTNTVALVNAR